MIKQKQKKEKDTLYGKRKKPKTENQEKYKSYRSIFFLQTLEKISPLWD